MGYFNKAFNFCQVLDESLKQEVQSAQYGGHTAIVLNSMAVRNNVKVTDSCDADTEYTFDDGSSIEVFFNRECASNPYFGAKIVVSSGLEAMENFESIELPYYG